MKYEEIRILPAEDLKQLCKQHHWYGRGTPGAFAHLIHVMAGGKSNLSTDDIIAIAEDIIKHSDPVPSVAVTDIAYEIANACTVTFRPAQPSSPLSMSTPDHMDIPDIGKLYIEHVFYQYGSEPILFTCRAKDGDLWIVSNCRLGENYLYARTSPENVIRMINNKVTLRDMFSPGFTSMITWTGNAFINEGAANPTLRPTPGAYLDLADPETIAYRTALQQKLTERRPDEC